LARAVKRPTKRVRLAAALREAMEPLMRAHGFDHPPKSARRWNNWFARADYWERWVGENRQEVYGYWPWRNSFRLVWSDDAINRERGRKTDFHLQSWRVWPISPALCGQSFGGLRPVDSAVRLAVRRVEALLRYWETGEAAAHLGLDQPTYQYRWPEEYDPETRGMKALDDPP